MITLITGAPGAGKSAALVSLLKQLSKGRTIYCNGIPELKIDHQDLEDPTKWHETVPDGSIIVIDEVQRFWRPQGPGKVTPDIAALETHRHRGIDFYIITQGPRLVHSNVRALVGRHVHLRDIGILGRWWYEWPECADQCATTWRGAPLKKRYRLPKAIFKDYKSASEHIKPIRSFPTMLVVMILALGVTGFMGYRTWTMIQGKINPAPVAQILNGQGGVLPASLTQPPAALPPVFIDDRIAFIPRLSDKPETAPAYDAMRVVVNMPRVAGGVCFKGVCKCLSQQGSTLEMTHTACKAWMDKPAFDPYTVQPVPSAPARAETVAARTPSDSHQSDQPPVVSASAPLNSGVVNPRAETRPPSIQGLALQGRTASTLESPKMPALSLLNPYRKNS